METLDLSIDEYHARPEISSGMIRCFATDGPWVCYHQYVTRETERDDSGSKCLGRVFHMAMEDPDTVDDRVMYMPQFVPSEWGELSSAEKKQGNGKQIPFQAKYSRHRKYRAEFIAKANAKGMEVLEHDKAMSIAEMVRSVWENPACRDYLGSGPETHEVACISRDAATKLKIRALADILLDDTIVDFKTTRMSTQRAFIMEARKRGYHYQAAHYLNVTGRKRFVIITVRNLPPYESMVYSVPEHVIKDAHESNSDIMWAIKNCIETESWHSLGWGSEVPLDYDMAL